MAVNIRTAESKADVNRFITLQWKFYGGDRNWVPPLLMDRRKLLNRSKNPFYKHAEMQLFIAESDGEDVGRIAAIVNHNHNTTHDDRVGFFGFFESVNRQDVADALLDAAADWLRSKRMDTMRGPMNPSVNDEIGLLVDGFERPPVLLMTYNPRYYPVLLETWGLRKEKDLYAYLLSTETTITPKLERVQAMVRERYNLTIRNIDFKNLDRDVVTLKQIYNQAWEKNWGAVAMTDEEFDFLAADLKQVIGDFKEFAFIAERNGIPVGFSLALPDINQALIHNRKGRLLPGIWHLLTQTRQIDTVRIIVLGVLPEFRGKGFDSVMYFETVTRAIRRGLKFGEASWVLEDNVMMNRAADLMNGQRYKTYRIYDAAI